MPVTPPNEASVPNQVSQSSTTTSEHANPFFINIQIDVMAVVLLLCGTFTRMLRLESPNNVVFDEMHYGKYASLYLKNTFFFDSNPPLGKMIIAFAGYLAGFDGKFSFDKIGQEYPHEIPLFALRLVFVLLIFFFVSSSISRFVPALCGSLLTPTVYLIMTELGLSYYAGGLAAFMVLFGKTLETLLFIIVDLILLNRYCHSHTVKIHIDGVNNDVLWVGSSFLCY